jgi:hypothetical protein
MHATEHVRIVFGVWPAVHFDTQVMFYGSKYRLIYLISIDTELTGYQVT